MGKNNWSLESSLFIIKKHFRSIIMFFIMINLTAVLSFGVVFNNHIQYVNNQIENNIIEYQEIDREQLCKIVNCIKVIDTINKKNYIPDSNGFLRIIEYNINTFNNIKDDLWITNEYDLSVFNKTAETHFIINTDEIFSEYFTLILIFVPFSLLMYIWPLMSSIKEEKEESLLINAGSEALLANRSMINITENIHHELNTPLEVIDNKIEKIHTQLSKFLLEEYETTQDIENLPADRVERNRKLVKLNEDFEFIKTSSEQIYAVLQKMKGFKHLRYSNGNKSFGNIIEGGFKIVNISNSNFEHKIDKYLYKYKIGSDLKNAELLSILLNHIKNSLEANASKIYILFNKYDDKLLYFRIIDNGNGIPPNIAKNIFRANFSTKKSDTGIRGNGMYLNKHIINNSGGNIKVVSSTNKGTTIEIGIPAIEK